MMSEEVVGRDPTGETQSCNIRVKELKVEEEKTGKPTQVAPGPKSGTFLVDQLHDQVVGEVDYHVRHEVVKKKFGHIVVSRRYIDA